MSLIQCKECGKTLSTTASACPHCGAKSASRSNRALRIATMLLGFVAFLFVLGTCQPAKTNPAKERAPVNFDMPVQTLPRALYCPAKVVLDSREGHGLQAAMNAHIELFDHVKDVEAIGCEEDRAGERFYLSEDAIKQAKTWQKKSLCGMLEHGNGFIFSCDLENVTDVTAESPAAEAPPSVTAESPTAEAPPSAVTERPAAEALPSAVTESPTAEAPPSAVTESPTAEAPPSAVTESPTAEAPPS